MLLLDEATSALDGAAQNRVTTACASGSEGRGIVWSLHRSGDGLRGFDEVIVFKNGPIAQPRADFEESTPMAAPCENSPTRIELFLSWGGVAP